MAQESANQGIAAHGSAALPSVTIDSYNVETKDEDGFIGDRASKSAFRDILEDLRKPMRKNGNGDPLGDKPSSDLTKKEIDGFLSDGTPEQAGLVHGAVEEFAKNLAFVIRRYTKLKGWQDTQRVVIGGGMSGSRVGELAAGRTATLLAADKIKIELALIHNDPDDAGLIGAAHLAPAWIFKGHDGILAIDIGGTNIRAGVVDLNLGKSKKLAKAKVWKSELWRHADDEPTRDGAIKRLVEMLEGLIRAAKKEKLNLAPFIGIGCPGFIEPDGSIDRGAQNLPGNWSRKDFNLIQELREAIPTIDKEQTLLLMHNDAVVQGLSEVPFMQDVERWGVLTIGTGLGNARFTNRDPEK